MYRLREKDVRRLARMTETSEDIITKLSAMDMLDHDRVMDALIRYSWRQLYRKDWLTKNDKYAALALEYNCSIYKVKGAIYGKRSKQSYCTQCGKAISKRDFNRFGGLCHECYIKKIQIDISTS